MSPASRFDALLFDFDGVLADTEKVHYECWSEILQPFGIAVSWEVYLRECVGMSMRICSAQAAHQRGQFPVLSLNSSVSVRTTGKLCAILWARYLQAGASGQSFVLSALMN